LAAVNNSYQFEQFFFANTFLNVFIYVETLSLKPFLFLGVTIVNFTSWSIFTNWNFLLNLFLFSTSKT
jgi:hypothetical protein